MTLATLDEDRLVAGIRSGDRDMFATVFRLHYAGLLRFASAQLRDRAEAEDAVHDVFLRLWRTRADLSLHGSLRTYLLAGVRHRVIDAVRRRSVEDRALAVHAGAATVPQWNHAASHAGDPAQHAELDDAIRRAIAALPERCRAAFLLCREHDLTYAEAAAVLGVSPATVKTQIARALAALRMSLEPFLVLVAAAASTLR